MALFFCSWDSKKGLEQGGFESGSTKEPTPARKGRKYERMTKKSTKSFSMLEDFVLACYFAIFLTKTASQTVLFILKWCVKYD